MKQNVIIFLLLFMFFSTACLAENELVIDSYTFQYNAFSADSLPAEMSSRYHFKRSKNSALVNITVIDNNSNIRFKGIKASVQGVMKNLLAQETKLTFKEIYEDQAYYYIAQVDIEHNDVVHLIISVQPEHAKRVYEVKFVKQFSNQ